MTHPIRPWVLRKSVARDAETEAVDTPHSLQRLMSQVAAYGHGASGRRAVGEAFVVCCDFLRDMVASNERQAPRAMAKRKLRHALHHEHIAGPHSTLEQTPSGPYDIPADDRYNDLLEVLYNVPAYLIAPDE